MLVRKITKFNVIKFLRTYAGTLGKRVKPSVYNKISAVYRMILRTTDDARYIEVSESEADTLLVEYLSNLCAKKNLAVCIYFGRMTSVYAREKIVVAMKNAAQIYMLPTNLDTKKMMILVSFLGEYKKEYYDVDYAVNILRYND